MQKSTELGLDILVIMFTAILLLSGCDDQKDKTTNHVYSSDDSTTTGTSFNNTSALEEAAREDPTQKFKERDKPLYMKPSMEQCLAVSVNDRDTDNFRYNVYCNENGSNVYHEDVPEYLLSTVRPQ